MGKICRGGAFDGMSVFNEADALTCRTHGGRVENTGGGCSVSAVEAVDGPGEHEETVTALRRAVGEYGSTDAVRLLEHLSRAAMPFVEEALARDDELAAEMRRGLTRLGGVAGRGVDPEHEGAVYTAEDHEALSALAVRVAAASGDARVAELADEAIAVAATFAGLPPGAVRDRFAPLPDLAGLEATVTDLPMTFTHSIGDAPPHPLFSTHNVLMSAKRALLASGFASTVLDAAAASDAIDAKAATLPGVAGETPGRMRSVPGGWVRPYPSADIYYSPETGAHEVHGDIRKKYDALSGPGWLGLPTTDETGTPDGRGRFNHFRNDASIYWTPTTGPMLVRGAIRQTWAEQGWERGPWGYPVGDEQRIPGLTPADAPNLAWSAFENATGFSQGNGCLEALAASVTAQQLANGVRAMVDQRLEPADFGPITARPGLGAVDVLGVEDFSYGFWGAVPRTLGVRLHGFVSAPVPRDPTFTIDLWLRFATTWPMAFTYPAYKTVIATLARYSVHVDGLFSETIASRITDKITQTFTPDPTRPEIPAWSIALGDFPTGASQHGSGDVNALDIMLMADGALHVLVNPIPPSLGAMRQRTAQRGLDVTLEHLG